MTRPFVLVIAWLMLLAHPAAAQVKPKPYPGLVQPAGALLPVYCTPGTEARAAAMATRCAAALAWMKQPGQLGFAPRVTMLVLGPADWKRYAAPGQVYGMPHTNGPSTLVVAGAENEFWQHTLPPTDLLPADLAQAVAATYRSADGQPSLGKMFDLLALHEMAHLAYRQAGLGRPRFWLEEFFCNLFLHTYIATQEPASLPVLETFPEAVVKGTDATKLRYTSLADFERLYGKMEREEPINYGWYQCRLHRAAARVYDAPPPGALARLWQALRGNKATYTDAELAAFLGKKVSPELARLLTGW